MPKSFAERFKAFIKEKHPDLASVDWTTPSTLASPHVLTAPVGALASAQRLVQSFYRLRNLPTFQEHVAQKTGALGAFDPGNASLFMSYDFHVTSDGNLKLIEINTNAAGFFIERELHMLAGLARPEHFSLSDLRQDFISETGTDQKKPLVMIVDEKPQEQFAYLDFLLARSAIQSWGWPCDIIAPQELLEKEEGSLHTPDGRKVDLIYNRLTDFFLDQHPQLKAAYLKKKLVLSPNPHEYFLLADKERLVEAGTPGWMESLGLSSDDANTIRHHIAHAKPLTTKTADECYADRKRLFFKPARSFGSKAGYRGDKISRQMFEKIVGDGSFLAQEFVPPGETEALIDETGQTGTFKYDLRFYAYKGIVRGVGARLFQGQLLNMRAPGSGFCAVKLID